MEDKFNDLIQVLLTLPAREGAELVNQYRASKMERPDEWSDWWYGSGGGMPTAAGININERSSLKFSPVFAAVRKISETVASLPRHVYREGSKGKKKDTDHYLYPIIHHRPNPEMTSMQMREAEMLHILLWGNTYSHIQQDGNGRAQALWPLDPSKMQVKRPKPDSMLVYEYQLGAETVKFPPWEILHIAGLGFNGLMGIPVIQLAREGIATGLAYEEYSGRFFSNNATPAGFVEVPGILDKEARREIQKDWYVEYGGVSRSQLIGVIGQGMKFNPISMNAKDAQFIESRGFQVEEVARWFNIPPHMIYDLRRSTNNNIEQQSLEFVIYTIRPWLVRIEQAIQNKLILEDNITVEHRVEGLLRGDTETRTAYYSAGRQWGWLSVNDILDLENMERVEGGDERITPMNMQQIGAPEGTNGKDKETEKLIKKMLAKQSQTQPQGET